MLWNLGSGTGVVELGWWDWGDGMRRLGGWQSLSRLAHKTLNRASTHPGFPPLRRVSTPHLERRARLGLLLACTRVVLCVQRGEPPQPRRQAVLEVPPVFRLPGQERARGLEQRQRTRTTQRDHGAAAVVNERAELRLLVAAVLQHLTAGLLVKGCGWVWGKGIAGIAPDSGVVG
eukprot:366449-Chlamydomonas_euryale.AAC.28